MHTHSHARTRVFMYLCACMLMHTRVCHVCVCFYFIYLPSAFLFTHVDRGHFCVPLLALLSLFVCSRFDGWRQAVIYGGNHTPQVSGSGDSLLTARWRSPRTIWKKMARVAASRWNGSRANTVCYIYLFIYFKVVLLSWKETDRDVWLTVDVVCVEPAM